MTYVYDFTCHWAKPVGDLRKYRIQNTEYHQTPNNLTILGECVTLTLRSIMPRMTTNFIFVSQLPRKVSSGCSRQCCTSEQPNIPICAAVSLSCTYPVNKGRCMVHESYVIGCRIAGSSTKISLNIIDHLSKCHQLLNQLHWQEYRLVLLVQCLSTGVSDDYLVWHVHISKIS